MWTEITDLTYDGDNVTGVKLRRGLESRPLWKTIEKMTPSVAIKWIDRFSALEAIPCEWALAGAFEKKAKLVIPERAEYLRALYLELGRLLWGFNYLAELFRALQDQAIYQQSLRLRELVFEAQETISGNRVLPQILEIGGARRDITAGEVRKVRNILANLEYEYRAFFKVLVADVIMARRLAGLVPIGRKTAESLSLRGPIGQASGLDRDLRCGRTSGCYSKLKIDVYTPEGADWFHEVRVPSLVGDAFHRMRAVIFHVRQSIGLIGNILDSMPIGTVLAEIKDGEDVSRINSTPIWYAVEGGSGPVIAVIWNGIVRLSSHSIRMSPYIEEILTGVHAEDFEVAAVSLGLDPSQVDLC